MEKKFLIKKCKSLEQFFASVRSAAIKTRSKLQSPSADISLQQAMNKFLENKKITAEAK